MYLVLRPQGGLNDILCTIYRCFLYCRNFNRQLIVHTSHAHENLLFADGIQHYFCSGDPSVQLGIQPGSEVAFLLSDLLDTQVDNAPWISEIKDGASRKTITRLDRGFAENILLYQSFGGGSLGVNALNLFTLSNEVRDKLSEHMAALPSSYNAIHCRHTDYQSDLADMQGLIRALAQDALPIYFATDSQDLLINVRNQFRNIELINSCSSFAAANVPIHHSSNARNRQTVFDMFADLCALALANSFVSSTILNPSDPSNTKSGFSILVEKLRELPKESLQKYFCGSFESSHPQQTDSCMSQAIPSSRITEWDADPSRTETSSDSCNLVTLQITIPTFKRLLEFKRLLGQIILQLAEMEVDKRSRVSVKILENPSEFTNSKIEFVNQLANSGVDIVFKCNQVNIGGDANIEQAYSEKSASDFVWVLGDDEQILPGAISTILGFLETHLSCGLLILADPSIDSRVSQHGQWDNYSHFAVWLAQIYPFLLISHSLVSLNVVRSGVYDLRASELERTVFARRAGLPGSYCHMTGIITGLDEHPDLSVCILPYPAVDASHRSPHEDVVFTWTLVRRLWRNYLAWLVHRFSLDCEQIRLHPSMRDVFPVN